MIEAPSISNDVQRSENRRKNPLLNYESPALTAELKALHVRNGYLYYYTLLAAGRYCYLAYKVVRNNS
jgi:hypothetical protein